MPLPSSGSISLSQVNAELGRSSTANISMNESAVRTLFGVGGSGTAISMSQGYGKSNVFNFTISTNRTNGNLRTLAINAGWNQSAKVVATIGSGVYVSANDNGTPGLNIEGSFPNGVELINNGFIVGMGGHGGKGAGLNGASVAGGSGGLALLVSVAVTITNNGTIAGGGGGGGGGGSFSGAYDPGNKTLVNFTSGGGGGGGGRTGSTNSPGGIGGTDAGSAGGAGTSSAAGNGGAAGNAGSIPGGAGGAGGGWGAAGSSGLANGLGGQSSGGIAGRSVFGNSNITWIATGTRLGGIV